MTRRFPEPPASVLEMEEAVLEFWKAENTFARSLEQTAAGEPFVFYEGPPTANGRPGIHHVLSRTIKDTVARFRTMQGRYVPRIAGWDTHGLPVEIEAEKRLGISGKREIEQLGIARFNEVCRESVLLYTDEWERFSARIGYWLDYSRPYVTFHAEYIETVWWLLKQIAERGLIFRGHKVLPYCPRCGTGLSSHELSLGYRDVQDPSLYFSAPVLARDGEPDGREFLVWTTTPWTVVSNVALAVNPELEYAEVEHDGRRYVLAAARVPALFGVEQQIARTIPASELVGLRYRRPLDWADPVGFPTEVVDRAWTVYAADWVSADDGTGLVHTAVAFGADDYKLGQEQGLPIIMPVDERGRFREEIPLVGGKFVKDADTELVIELKRRGRVFRSSRETHSYPHCWRCGSPLLYMARDSWFIRTTDVREQMLANNRETRWFPPEVGSGRFGEWLENNVDWAISRNRYWGTPLPAWVCDAEPSHLEWIGSFPELRERAGSLPEPFDPHRPFIDEIAWPCAQCSGTMRRTPEVIDVWFDSGAMPFAQHHYPFANQQTFERQFPADFICEGVDQTRGWFYSLLAISTLLGRGPAYRNVVVNDLILDAEGLKMSKSRGNVVNPWDAIAEHGADAIRWYLLASSHPWLPKRFDPEGVRETQRKTFDTLRQTYRFFALYANLEGWQPGSEPLATAELGLLDRWILSRLASTVERVSGSLAEYNLTHAVRTISELIIDDVSNWYVRRSRDRFWGSSDSADTRAAFGVLHQVLATTARLMAPFAPFASDWLHRALDETSVHLTAFPEPSPDQVDPELERAMEVVRALSTLGRAAREQVKIRVRQPLGVVHAVIPAGMTLDDDLLEIVRDELNVRRVELLGSSEELVTLSARPNFKALGKKFGKQTQLVAEAIRALESRDLAAFRRGEPLHVAADGVRAVLDAEDLEIVQTARGNLATESDGTFTVALDPTITPELRSEGLARELVNRVQRFRKEAGLAVADRIVLHVGGDPELVDATRDFGDFLARETLAREIQLREEVPSGAQTVDLDGVAGWVSLAPWNESVDDD